MCFISIVTADAQGHQWQWQLTKFCIIWCINKQAVNIRSLLDICHCLWRSIARLLQQKEVRSCRWSPLLKGFAHNSHYCWQSATSTLASCNYYQGPPILEGPSKASSYSSKWAHHLQSTERRLLLQCSDEQLLCKLPTASAYLYVFIITISKNVTG